MRVRVANRARGGAWAIARLVAVVATWALLVTPVVVGVIAVTTLRRWAKDLPAVPDLDAWTDQVPRSSVILAADGTILDELAFREGREVGHRWIVRYDELPRQLIEALLAAEDVRFFEHDGVDLQAVVRAAWANYRAGRIVEGASTITQQVARYLLPEEIGNERSLRRKVREALLARELERVWSKQQILAVYVNFVFLGSNAYGVRAAARAYFDRELDELTVAQAAMIAGLAQAPGRADPNKDRDAALARRDQVITRMHRAGFLDDAERDAALAEPMTLTPRPDIYGTESPWYNEHVRRLLAENLPGEYDLGGLVVETAAVPALDVDAAIAARDRTDELRRAGATPEVGAIVWDHRTGYVEALIGGRTWGRSAEGDSQFDRVLQSCRQPGSAWKPIVYGAALERGSITQGTPLRDAPIAEYDEVTNVHWKPKSGKRFRGVALAADAFASSLNAPAIDVLDRVGVAPVIDYARRLGISTDVADVRPMALGASCVKPIELARAYAVLARRGWSVTPRFVVRIQRGADLIFDAAVPEDPWLDPARRLDRVAAVAGLDPDQRVGLDSAEGPVTDEASAFLITDLMAGVVQRGTGTGAKRVHRPAAGKTGTTNDNTDAWFVGFTARVLTAVWIGFDDPSATLGPRDDGARAALPLWIELVRASEGTRPDAPVPGEAPAGLIRARIDRETGLLAAPGAGGSRTLWFKRGSEPSDVAGSVAGTSADFGRTAHEF